MIVGFTLGALLGIALGLLLGMSRTAERAVAPSLMRCGRCALFAWIPLLTAWFGNGEGSKIVYIVMSAFFPAALKTCRGPAQHPSAYCEVAKCDAVCRGASA